MPTTLKTFRLEDEYLFILNKLKHTDDFKSETEVLKAGLQMLKDKYNLNIQFTEVQTDLPKFSDALSVCKNGMAYEYKLAGKMTDEELKDYTENYKEKEFTLKDYWVLKEKELL